MDLDPTKYRPPPAVRPGDAFSLVTTGGPKFIIELDLLPEEVRKERAEKRQKTGKSKLSKGALAGEAKRQAFTRLLVMGPAQIAQRAITFVRSGASYQPRNIFMGVALLGGWVFGGVTMCNSRSMKSDLEVTNQRYENCEKELEFAENLGGDSTESSFDQLAAKIVGAVHSFGEALEEDSALRSMVKKKAKTVFANSKRYGWLVQNAGPKASRFAEWRERVMGENALDEDTQRLLVWLAGTPGRLNSEFIEVNDSENETVCGRGSLQMTYRQAVSLGMAAQADALVEKDYEEVVKDKSKQESLLEDTIAAAGGAGLPDDTFETEFDPVRQGRSACLYIDGSDDRGQASAVMNSFSQHLGENPEDLPPWGAPNSSVARLAKYWAET